MATRADSPATMTVPAEAVTPLTLLCCQAEPPKINANRANAVPPSNSSVAILKSRTK